MLTSIRHAFKKQPIVLAMRSFSDASHASSDWLLRRRGDDDESSSPIDPAEALSQLPSNLYAAVADVKSSSKATPEFLSLQSRILNKMQLNQKVGDMKVVLSQKFNDENIEIEFDCGDVDEEEEEEEEEASDFEEPPTSLPFTVSVTKKSKNGSLVFECLAGEYLEIDSVKFVDDATSETHYEGPLLEELDEETQVGFEEYLRTRGIDDELSRFISEYSDVKEEHEYSRFCSKAAEFIE